MTGTPTRSETSDGRIPPPGAHAPLLGRPDELAPTSYVAAIGASAPRRAVAERLESRDWIPVSLAHPDAICGANNRLAEGVIRFPRSVVSTNVTIGRHTHLNVGVVVQHDSVIGDFVTLSPGVFVNGDVTIGDDVFVGTGAILTRGVRVGDGARIGAGAVVLDDVPAASLVVGIPARAR